jgi:hypothetical protein
MKTKSGLKTEPALPRVLLARLLEREAEHTRLLDGLQKFGLNVDVMRLDLLEVVLDAIGIDRDSETAANAYRHWINVAGSHKRGAIDGYLDQIIRQSQEAA